MLARSILHRPEVPVCLEIKASSSFGGTELEAEVRRLVAERDSVSLAAEVLRLDNAQLRAMVRSISKNIGLPETAWVMP